MAPRYLIVLLSAWICAACTADPVPTEPAAGRDGTTRETSPETLHPVALPDLRRADEAFRTRVTAAHETLQAHMEALDQSPTSSSEPVALASGRVGMLILAADYYDAAEPYLLNAQSLAPDEFRWPYYLGHLYRSRGDDRSAVQSFERAIRLRPDDAAALVGLSEIHLDQGRLDQAETLLMQAAQADGESAAVHYGRGRVALARQDYPRAVEHLEAALAEQPTAASIHYPLGIAYRGLGDMTRAARYLESAQGGTVRPDDPWLHELSTLVDGVQMFRERGLAAAAAGRWAEAAAQFRRSTEAAPGDPIARLNFGSALARVGATEAALVQYERALELSPEYAKAHYARARLMARAGRDRAAVEGYTAAVQSDPGYVDAHLALADLRRRTGDAGRALGSYERVLEIQPSRAEARLGRGLTLVALERYQDARQQFVEAMALHPDEPVFTHALARVLAAAPDDSVRNGQRALELVQLLSQRQQSLELTETLAMALAELGRFDDAVRWQRTAVTSATAAGQTDVALRMSERLSLYAQRRPNRTPWHPDHSLRLQQRPQVSVFEAEPSL